MTGVFKAVCPRCGQVRAGAADSRSLNPEIQAHIIDWLRRGDKVEYLKDGKVAIGWCECMKKEARNA